MWFFYHQSLEISINILLKMNKMMPNHISGFTTYNHKKRFSVYWGGYIGHCVSFYESICGQNAFTDFFFNMWLHPYLLVLYKKFKWIAIWTDWKNSFSTPNWRPPNPDRWVRLQRHQYTVRGEVRPQLLWLNLCVTWTLPTDKCQMQKQSSVVVDNCAMWFLALIAIHWSL